MGRGIYDTVMIRDTRTNMSEIYCNYCARDGSSRSLSDEVKNRELGETD